MLDHDGLDLRVGQCRSVLVLSPIGSISLSYNAIKCNIIDKMLELFQTPSLSPGSTPAVGSHYGSGCGREPTLLTPDFDRVVQISQSCPSCVQLSAAAPARSLCLELFGCSGSP